MLKARIDFEIGWIEDRDACNPAEVFVTRQKRQVMLFCSGGYPKIVLRNDGMHQFQAAPNLDIKGYRRSQNWKEEHYRDKVLEPLHLSMWEIMGAEPANLQLGQNHGWQIDLAHRFQDGEPRPATEIIDENAGVYDQPTGKAHLRSRILAR